jgi:hypothetical protein
LGLQGYELAVQWFLTKWAGKFIDILADVVDERKLFF